MANRPTVVSGARSPKDAPERELDKLKTSMVDLALEALNAAKKAEEAVVRPPGVREFGAAFRNFKLTVRRSEEREVNGITIPAKMQTIAFEDGVYRTSDPVVIAAIESHKNYGRDLWDSDELRVRAERAAAEGFLARVDDLPVDIKEQLKVKLGMRDFQMPAPEPDALRDAEQPSA